MIHSFVCGDDGSEALRGVLCGIEFAPNAFIINTGVLKKLMCRSKSCMNGCFLRLGYAVCRPERDLQGVFAALIPGWREQGFSARQWCVRKAIGSRSFTLSANVPFDVVNDVGAVKEEREAVSWIFDIRNFLNGPPPQARKEEEPGS